MIHITPMHMMDLLEVLAIEEVSHLEPWPPGSFLEEFERLQSSLFVVRDSAASDKVVGYICFWIVADEVQILNIAVHPDYRGRGIGRRLLVRALRTGCERSARVAVLEVRESNTPARKLYERLGFHSVGERPNYYGNRKEAAILMELTLNGLDATHLDEEAGS